MRYLGDLVIRRFHHRASLGLVPQAIGGGDGQHHDHERQVALHAGLGLLREPARQPPELLAVAEQAVLDPTAVVVAVDHRPGVTDGGIGQVNAFTSRFRRPVAPQVDNHGHAGRDAAPSARAARPRREGESRPNAAGRRPSAPATPTPRWWPPVRAHGAPFRGVHRSASRPVRPRRQTRTAMFDLAITTKVMPNSCRAYRLAPST